MSSQASPLSPPPPPTSTTPANPPVLILGAGIAGLCLAQSLHRSGVPFRLYERDPVFNQRAQGYRVRIHSVGIDALKATLPDDLHARLKKCCAASSGGMGPVHRLDAVSGEKSVGQGFGPGAPPGGARELAAVAAAGGAPGAGAKVAAAAGPSSGDRAPLLGNFERPPEEIEALNADRTVLRDVLIRGVEEYVEFGKDFVSFEITDQGVKVRFADGTEIEGALLVGADGAGSRVRKQLAPELGLWDTEGRFVYGKTVITKELEERLDKRCLEAMTMIHDPTREVPLRLLLEPVRFGDSEFRKDLPENYMYWVLINRRDGFEMEDDALRKLPGPDVAHLIKGLTSHWLPSFQALFDLQDTSKTAALRIPSMKPGFTIGDSSKRVTLMGDAVHAMAPTAAAGANTALRDAATLSEILRDAGVGPDSVRKYEERMQHYASETIKRSMMGGKAIFGMPPEEEWKRVTA